MMSKEVHHALLIFCGKGLSHVSVVSFLLAEKKTPARSTLFIENFHKRNHSLINSPFLPESNFTVQVKGEKW
jgi:hypothetical protein